MTMTERAEDQPARNRQPRWRKQDIATDFGASLVVFLVAVPLCVGIAVASGVPAELGIVTGIVGGIVVGLLPGSSLQVSGPAAGLTVLVADAVSRHGLPALGVIVLGAGFLQIVLGLLRLGEWFRAISPSVVQGMLAGIGLVLLLGQIYPMTGTAQPETTADKVLGLPNLVADALTQPAAMLVGLLTIATILGWQQMPAKVRLVPGALIAVVLASAVTALVGLPVATVEVGGLTSVLGGLGGHDWGLLTDPSVLGSVLTFALVASAESLFSAAAVDRMHDGPPTRYNAELVAQGVGNTVSGVLGALPMTAVIVRSATNVQAGARTRASRVMHGVWLLVFAVLLPGLLALVPLAVLAALLMHAGWKLLEIPRLIALARTNRAEAAVVLITAGTIAAVDLLVGVLVGLGVAITKTAWDVSHLSVSTTSTAEGVHVVLHGTATFLRLPRLLQLLRSVPSTPRTELDLTGLRHLDQACLQAVEQWASERRRETGQVHVTLPVQAS